MISTNVLFMNLLLLLLVLLGLKRNQLNRLKNNIRKIICF